MLFSKNIEPKCEYCRKAQPFENCSEVGCIRRGVMDSDEKCRRFVYDPLKRDPEPPALYHAREFDADEFQL